MYVQFYTGMFDSSIILLRRSMAKSSQLWCLRVTSGTMKMKQELHHSTVMYAVCGVYVGGQYLFSLGQ